MVRVGVREAASKGRLSTMSAGDDGAAEEFAETVRARVRRARGGLKDAASRRDEVAVRTAVDEMEEALALARAHRVEVPGSDAAEAGPEEC